MSLTQKIYAFITSYTLTKRKSATLLTPLEILGVISLVNLWQTIGKKVLYHYLHLHILIILSLNIFLCLLAIYIFSFYELSMLALFFPFFHEHSFPY